MNFCYFLRKESVGWEELVGQGTLLAFLVFGEATRTRILAIECQCCHGL